MVAAEVEALAVEAAGVLVAAAEASVGEAECRDRLMVALGLRTAAQDRLTAAPGHHMEVGPRLIAVHPTAAQVSRFAATLTAGVQSIDRSADHQHSAARPVR